MTRKIDIETMRKVQSPQGKITPDFVDYCNLNNINLRDWYRWQLHLIWQRRKDAKQAQTTAERKETKIC